MNTTDKSNGGNGAPAPGNVATEGNKSTKPVQGVSPTQKVDDGNVDAAKSSKPDPDDGKASNASAAAVQIGQANTDAASKQADDDKKAALERETIATKDSEFERALAEKDGELSADQQSALDRALGDHSERSEIDDMVDDARNRHVDADKNVHKRLEGFMAGYGNPVEVITKMVRDIPVDTPDDFILYGSQGHKLRLGHLRALVMGK